MTGRQFVLAFCLVAFLGSDVFAQSFQGLGDLPGGRYWSRPDGVSADGSVVVGESRATVPTSEDGLLAFRWENNVLTGLERTPQQISASPLVSGDGQVVVATVQNEVIGTQAHFVTADSTTLVSDATDGSFLERVGGISHDGSVVVGDIIFPVETEQGTLGRFVGYRWESGELSRVVPEELVPEDVSTLPTDISADGTLTVGRWMPIFDADRSFLYDGSTLSILSAPQFSLGFTSVSAISPEGDWIVGTGSPSGNSSDRRGFVLHAGTYSLIPDLVSGEPFHVAMDVSQDGRVIVGSSFSSDPAVAVMHLDSQSISVKQWLQERNVAGLDSWHLEQATAVSADGSTVIGIGINPSGVYEAWMARLVPVPEPSSLLLVVFGLLSLSRYLRTA